MYTTKQSPVMTITTKKELYKAFKERMDVYKTIWVLERKEDKTKGERARIGIKRIEVGLYTFYIKQYIKNLED